MRQINWKRLVQMMQERKLDALVATHPDAASYLTNIYSVTFHINPVYHMHPVFAVVTQNKEVFSIDTDKPIEEFEKPPWLKRIYPRRLQLLDLDYRLDLLATGLRDKGLEGGRLGYDGLGTPAYIKERLVELLPKAEWVPADIVFQQTMAEKTYWEIQNLKRGVQVWDRCFKELMQTLEEGETFNDIIARLANLAIKHNSFLAWTNPGVRAWQWQPARPELLPQDQVIERHKVFWIDFGLRQEGYYIDMARSFVLGKASSWSKEVARGAAMCHKLITDILRPGITCREAYDAIRAEFDHRAPTASIFINGIGLNITEHPIVFIQEGQNAREVHSTELRFHPGTVFVIEPWIPKDMYLMTKHGPRRLSTLALDIIEA